MGSVAAGALVGGGCRQCQVPNARAVAAGPGASRALPWGTTGWSDPIWTRAAVLKRVFTPKGEGRAWPSVRLPHRGACAWGPG